MNQDYIAIVHGEHGNYDVVFPDFPGCISFGVDINDAMKNSEESLSLHLAGMVEDDEYIPSSSSLEEARIKAIELEIEKYDIIQVTGVIPDTN